MMKKSVLYPLLFSINPILLLFSANVSDIPFPNLFPSILISPLLVSGIFYILWRKLHNFQRAAFIVFLFELWFFHYGTFHQLVNPLWSKITNFNAHWLMIPIWSLVFIVIGSKWVWRNVRSPEFITKFLTILAMVLVLVSTGRILLDIIPRYTYRPASNDIAMSIKQQSSGKSRPDIYYLVLDGYARQDVLAELFDFDNQEFIDALQNRGFKVSSKSLSNYSQTALSLASSLNMEYLSDISTLIPDRGPLIGRIAHSQVRSILEGLDYKFVAFSSGYLPTEIMDSDNYYAPPTTNRAFDFEGYLAVNTILKPLFESGLVKLPISKYAEQQERIQFTFHALTSFTPQMEPKFVFAHILIPHPPFIFDENGPITPQEFYILADGERLGFSTDAYQTGYIDQIRFTNHSLLQTIDQILDNSTQPPIIIIQADHGSGLYLNTASSTQTCVFERFSILSAIYLPDQLNVYFPDEISSVNLFRQIFNIYFETNFDLLTDQYYYSSWEQPYKFIDVSERIDSPCTQQ